jgi:hypothetical protein
MDQEYSENMLKARMAETLFEELMRVSGNTIYRFGYEAIMQNLTQLREKFDRYNGVGKRIRSIPDFIVLDKDGKPMFVEVKYRWNAQAHVADQERFESIRELWGATVVIVSCLEKPYFHVTRPPYFTEGNQLLLAPLLSAKEFNVKQEEYNKYEILVEKYLSHTLIPKKS